MLRKGFTLIELLIVITIIAILAGAAIPYVQDYIEDARLAKARADLGELRNAIIRFETERGKAFGFAADGVTPLAADAFQEQLVGPYLQKALADPWGTPYFFSNEASIVYSAAQDRDTTTNIIALDFRPAFAGTRAYWKDNDNNGRASAGDVVSIKFTRPVQAVAAATTIGNYGVPTLGSFDGTAVAAITSDDRVVDITMTASCDIRSGRDEILVNAAVIDKSDLAVDENAVNLGLTAQPAAQIRVPVLAAQ